MRRLIVFCLALSAVPAAQDRQTFTGTIIDDACARGGHATMRMGANDAECTRLCVAAHGSEYVLLAGRAIYKLSDQKTPERFAAQRVVVSGRLNTDTNTIRVESIAAAE